MTTCGAKLFFCILFVTCCCTVAFSQIPMDCCLSVTNKKPNKDSLRNLFVDYFQQISGQGCAINATVLKTKHGVKLCFPANKKWVQDVVKQVVEMKKRCKKRHNQHTYCNKVKQK